MDENSHWVRLSYDMTNYPELGVGFGGGGVLGLSDLFLDLHFSFYRTRPHAITADYSSGISSLFVELIVFVL